MPTHSKTPVMKHSPTPWTVEAGENVIFIYDSREGLPSLAHVGKRDQDHDGYANAAHICLCVNAHEELKAKLLEVVSIFQGRVHSTAAMNVLHEASELIARLNGVSQ